MKISTNAVAMGVAAVFGFGIFASSASAADVAGGDGQDIIGVLRHGKADLVTVRKAGEKPVEYLIVRKAGGEQQDLRVRKQGQEQQDLRKAGGTPVEYLRVRKQGQEQQDLRKAGGDANLVKGGKGGQGGKGGKKK